MENAMTTPHTPHSVETEHRVLGAMMMDCQAVETAAAVLDDGAAFHSIRARTLYRYMVSTADSGKPVTLDQLAQDVARIGLKMEGHDATVWLDDVGASVGTSVHVKHDANRVLDYHLRRQLKTLAWRIQTAADDPEADVREIVAMVERTIIDNVPSEEFEVFSLEDCVSQAFEAMEKRARCCRKYAGASSGYDELDMITGGFRDGEFIVIAARPSVGKTAFALNLFRNMSAQGIPAAFFSLEMARDPVTTRLLSSVSQVEEHRLNTGEVLARGDDEDAIALRKAGEILSALPGFIGDPGKNMTCTQIRAKARRLVHSPDTKVRAVFIDYLHLIEPTERTDNRVQELERISKNLKALARELNVPVVVLSQLNRETEQSGRKPKLHNLKGSGAIEQDADVVIMLDRDDRRGNSEPGFLNLTVEKNRNGRTGECSLRCRPDIQLVESLKD